MASVTKLREAAPPPDALSPERRHLAEAIKRRDELEAKYRGLYEAASWSGHAVQAVTRAEERLEEARGAIEAAKAASVESLVSGAAGAADGIRAARLAFQCAVDDLEAATTARDTLKARLAEAEKQREIWNYPVEKAAHAVMLAECDTAVMLERIEYLQRELVRVGSGMKWLVGANVIPRDTDSYARAQMCVDPAIQTAMDRYHSPAHSWTELMKIPDLRSDVRWAEALTALMVDAAATLPG